MELRCNSRMLHGIVHDDIIEFTCRSRRCGKRPGVVVLHRFNLNTGKIIDTQRFAEPNMKGDKRDIAQSAAVRSA